MKPVLACAFVRTVTDALKSILLIFISPFYNFHKCYFLIRIFFLKPKFLVIEVYELIEVCKFLFHVINVVCRFWLAI